MSKFKITLGIIIIIIFCGGSLLILSKDSQGYQYSSNTLVSKESLNPNTATTTKPIIKPIPTPVPTTKQYSMTEVAQHNSAQSCWSAINNKVYDLTTWIGQHPGGSNAILSICGKDGSNAFNDQHGGQRRPANELTNFLIGDLK